MKKQIMFITLSILSINLCSNPITILFKKATTTKTRTILSTLTTYYTASTVALSSMKDDFITKSTENPLATFAEATVLPVAWVKYQTEKLASIQRSKN